MELTQAPVAPLQSSRRVAPAGAPATPALEPARRLASLDVFRGLTMLFMASEIMRIPTVAKQFAESRIAQRLAVGLDHVPWTGFVPWDLIQPSFMFMVGVAVPYSVASRRAKGDPTSRILGHALWRSLLPLIL